MRQVLDKQAMKNRFQGQDATYYAHTPGPNGWHSLEDHLQGVAALAQHMGDRCGLGDLCKALGELHDLGKANPTFQQYLTAQHQDQRMNSVPHSIWGAALLYHLLARVKKSDTWKELALPILGHHGGLTSAGRAARILEDFLTNHEHSIERMSSWLKALDMKLPPLHIKPASPTDRDLRIRMAYSCLVDADYLDTERHFNPVSSTHRRGTSPLKDLWKRFKENQYQLLTKAPDTRVNRIRRDIYEQCIARAPNEPGIYRLTVPTGGGKTRSGLGFALQHALNNDLQRIIFAIPYTSIIDQTAQVYREILGENAILEHHSQVEVREDESQYPGAVRQRLATQNWDAPLVVTTTVQLFDSLFSNRPSRVRKLHNLARAVIVLDEAQTLPPGLLGPTLDVLYSLVDYYGASVVLSTATQPAFDSVPTPRQAQPVLGQEIVEQYEDHFRKLRRVDYNFRATPISWKELASEITDTPQVLVVLNSRKDAVALLEALDDTPDVLHLSTLLCGAHRRDILQDVKSRLASGQRIRLVSTQVVEAGVDLDFPVAYRAVGPLDRIVQVAGRCNREGKRKTGHVVIFDPADGRAPRGPYKVGMEKARLLLEEYPAQALHEPNIYRAYFERLYADVALDTKEIQPLREMLDYPEVAKRYHLIDSETLPVVVPYGTSSECLEDWRSATSQHTWRKLQPYLVNLYQWEAKKHLSCGNLEPIYNGVYRWKGVYDDVRGIAAVQHDPSDLVV